VNIPLQDLRAEYRPIKHEVMQAIEQVLDDMTLYLGPNVREFEREFAAYIGTRHAVGVSSGTDALLLAYMALGVQPGDEVIVPSHTFIATVAPLSFLGARPVFVDIDPVTFTIDPARLEAALTPRTRGVVPVHLYGQAADMDPILAFARAHGLWVAEDAAQAVGADYRGRKLGAFGEAGCFSFIFTKNLRAYGDAGMITTDDDALAERVRRLRDHGRTDKYTHPSHGLNARLNEIPAAILRVQMRYHEERTRARQANARSLDEGLRGAGVAIPAVRPGARHVYHLYVVRSAGRDALATQLAERGIQTGVHYPIPCHLQGACRAWSAGKGSLPHTERAADEILTLPVYPELTREQLDYLIDAVRAAAAVPLAAGGVR